jgi:hypothetical protein
MDLVALANDLVELRVEALRRGLPRMHRDRVDGVLNTIKVVEMARQQQDRRNG